jgi:hypothetical protein
MNQTVYSVAVILLGVADVVLAGVVYSQRARQLAGRSLGERQLELAALMRWLPHGRSRDRGGSGLPSRGAWRPDKHVLPVRLVNQRFGV